MHNQILKNTLIAVPSTSIGGVANYYKSIYPYLKNHNISYLPIGINKPGTLSIISLIKSIYDLKNKINKKNYSVYIVNPSLDIKSIIRDTILVMIAKNNALRVIIFFRGWNVNYERCINIFPSLIRPLLKNANCIIVLSSDFKKALRKWGFNKHISIETTTFNRDILDFIKKNKNKSDTLNLLFLSRLLKEKGIYTTIDTFRLIRRKNKNVKLIIAGDGPEKENIIKLTSKDESIEILGWLEGKEKYQKLKNSDIFIFPTYHNEGMPNSILEAMAFGLPVITRNVGGLKDFFKNEKNGFITKSKDPKIFAKYLERLLVDNKLRKNISNYNTNYAMKVFSPEIVSSRIIKIIKCQQS